MWCNYIQQMFLIYHYSIKIIWNEPNEYKISKNTYKSYNQ
jgi:hypothetical protein